MLRLARKEPSEPDSFLDDVSGIVHVGANTGQEREIYSARGLRVVWIEPIPEIFDQLKANISGLEGQRAFQALVTDVDGKVYELHIANNNGESSSILELKQHKDIWPEVDYTRTISLASITLATLIENEHLDISQYQALVMDTQGSELLVLQGGLPILKSFRYIKTEVSDFESYQGCCQLSDIRSFMAKHGYREFACSRFASRAGGGSYFNIVYKRKT